MRDYQKYINALRKCAIEHDNDRTPTGHIIVSDLCRDTTNLLEALEQESVLDKIRDEIERKAHSGQWSDATMYGMLKAVAIIDKYKIESEE